MSVNKVILVGRLGRDPETRYTSGGQAVANFSLATDESFKDRSGERQKRTEWHKIVVWGKQAEIAQQYLKKGVSTRVYWYFAGLDFGAAVQGYFFAGAVAGFKSAANFCRSATEEESSWYSAGSFSRLAT